ncbi:DUF4142 domain-containing protein [Wenjunlia tyrosinilytica]|uniref:DUF4142 domain-containing protein n=1 Tax=Wenjunlia tyrosinilytica TaxID=1544741 RepID=A0A917ZXM6_9ACTN|nr:hypothetical protein GCM10012280_54200 [Wenjunlia tyrosinilytica]
MRSTTGTGLIVAALAATLAALIFPVTKFNGSNAASSGDPNSGAVATKFGPLTPSDRDFIEKVRLAGLWELPAGQQAMERGSTKAIRRAGQHLIDGHTALDREVRDVASQLGVDLPNQPNDQQRRWLGELSAASGRDYEVKFANFLRLAHGRVFEFVAKERNGTRNTLVRQLANSANTTVLDHITVLEETGLVDFEMVAREQAKQAAAGGKPSTADPSFTAPPTPAPPVTPSSDNSLPPAWTAPPKN